MAKTPPAFQLYANDFMDGTRSWDANAVGLYIRCLCVQWTHGSIPSDLKVLARAIHCDRSELESVWPVLGEKFPAGEDGKLRNRRLEEVRERQQSISAKRSKAGLAGVVARSSVQATDQTKTQQRKVKEKEKVKVEVEKEGEGQKVYDAILWPDFKDFFDLYNKRCGKPSAEREWKKLSQKDREAVMQALPDYIAAKPDKTFRKDPERYLKTRAWEDEIIEPTNGTGQARTPTPDQAARKTAEYFARKRGSKPPEPTGNTEPEGANTAGVKT